MDLATEKLNEWYESLLAHLPNMAVAVVIFVLFFFLSRLGRKLTTKILSRVIDNAAIAKLMANIASTAILTIGLFVILGILDLDQAFTSLLAGAGVVGLAIGLAFQDPIINLLSGIDLASRKTYELGDLVETNGYLGFVQKISLRTTILKTTSGQDLVIPNKKIAQEPFINYTLTNERRIELNCGISYNAPLKDVERVATEAIKGLPNILTEKGIYFFYNEFGDSGVNFTLYFWCDTAEQNAFLSLRHKAIIAVKDALDKNNFTIPYPTRSILMNPAEF